MAAWLIPLAIARTVVSLAGRKGPEAARKRFAEKYGKDVVDKAQRVIQQNARAKAKKSTPSQFKEAEKTRKMDKVSKALRTKPEQKDKRIFPKKDIEIREQPLELSNYKKGGLVKKSKKKSIDGIARKGKTRAKHR